MKVIFNKVDIEAILGDITIEAESITDAKNKLFGMSLKDLIDNSDYFGDCEIKDNKEDLDYGIAEADAIVDVTDIQYDEEDLEDANNLGIVLPTDISDLTVESVGGDGTSPIVEEEDVKDAVENYIYDKYKKWYFPSDISFDVKSYK